VTRSGASTRAGWPLKYPLRLAGSVLGLGLAAAAQAAMDRSVLLPVAPSVVKIEAISPNGNYHLGSGVIVGEGKVVTNCHVTRHADRVAVVKGGIRWSASGQSVDLVRDLCVLRVPRIEGDPAPIARASTLKIGQPVMAIGYTGGVTLQLSEGAVVALHDWSGSRIIQSSNWFSSGASGGGLFNAEGALVGILTFRLRGGGAHYFAAPADWLAGQIDDDSRYQRFARIDGETYWERPSESQPYFLQAAALEQRMQWPALAALAQRWSAEADGVAEAAYMLGRAYEGLGRHEESIVALRRCLELDPGYAASWARLASLYKRQGRMGDVRMALNGLASLDPEQARTLSSELEKP
jgi:serine protease Do